MAERRAFANWMLLVLLFAAAGAAVAAPICNVDSSQFNLCMPAVTGSNPPPPSPACCSVVRRVDIPCLCGYENYLPQFGLNPKYVFALPGKCGVKTKPPCVP